MPDSLLDKIVAALSNPELDWRKFQRCMADLLRRELPGLVPIVGGSDFGMDGAIPDCEGEPYPLVCTISKDVIGNLTRSLDAHIHAGSPSRKVVIATSRALTPLQQKHLKERAREKGFQLIQTFDQRAIAKMLYWNPRARLELLGISGQPAGLTAVPRTRRPLIEFSPLGREKDLAWVRDTEGDRVLVGQPGSGKTFLLHHLIHDRGWNALFLNVDSSPGDVADAWREMQPDVVIVDDAHAYRQQLETLIAVRQQICGRDRATNSPSPFWIVATTWPSGKDRTIELLGGTAGVHALELLTRREIQTIIEQLGILGPSALIRELIDQSANRPGLAATLARLVVLGNGQEVRDGSALRRTFLHDFQSEAQSLLAALSLGGDRGVGMGRARDYLGISRADAWKTAVDLSAAGVLKDLGEDVLAVWPRSLRWQLVKTVFFEAPRMDDYRRLLADVESRTDAVLTLLYAKGRCRAAISPGELRQLVYEQDDVKLWRILVQLSGEDAAWVLDSYPHDILSIAGEALRSAPLPTLTRVFERAVQTAGEERPRPDPWTVVRSWAEEILPNPQEEVARRRMLARAGIAFLAQDRRVGTRAVFLALDPAHRDSNVDPAMGDTVTMRWGLLDKLGLEALIALWEEVRASLTAIDTRAWNEVEHTLWNWIHPERLPPGNLSEEISSFMRAFATEVLRAIAPLGAGRPGLSIRLKRLAAHCGATLDVETDEAFELVYPNFRELASYDQQLIAAHAGKIEELAREWSSHPPAAIAMRLEVYEKEAKSCGSWPGRTKDLARRLARHVTHPETWFEAFLEHRLPHLAAMFSEVVVETRRAGWEDHLARCLRLAPVRFSAVEQLLQLSDPPPTLLKEALRASEELTTVVDTLASRRLIPPETLRRILHHPSWEVALAAAVGEWNAADEGGERGGVRDELSADWQEVILRSQGGEYLDTGGRHDLDYWLQVFLRRDPQLALAWLERRLGEDDLPYALSSGGSFAAAIAALSCEQRAYLLGKIEDVPAASFLVERLVAGDSALYRNLLARRELAPYHHAPLGGVPDGRWSDLALAALDAGYSPGDIAAAAFYTTEGSIYGRHPFEPWEPAFATLAGHSDPRLQEVARHGLAIAQRHADSAAAERRHAELYGLGGP